MNNIGGGRQEAGGGRLRREGSRLGFLVVDTRCMNESVQYIFFIGMTFNIHEFAWVDAYLSCGCATQDHTTPFNF